MKYFYKDKEYFYVGFNYDPILVNQVKKFSGAGYNPENKEWYIPITLFAINPLQKWLNENNFVENKCYIPSKRVLNYVKPPEEITAQDVFDACLEMGLKRIPRMYQCEGIAYMLNHKNCINGDDCGLGKTGMQICVIELLDAFPALVICPSSVKYNWKKEWLKWNPDRKIGVVDKKTKLDNSVWGNDVVIINFDLLSERNTDKPTVKFKELIKKFWSSCAIDEIHFLKSSKAIRTKLVSKITAKIQNVWGLTGTLTQNKPSDLIQPFKIIRRFEEIFGSTLEFKYRYCNAKKTNFGFDTGGFSNLEELHELLQMSGYVRRNKRDVLKELPPLVKQIIEVPIDNIKEYSRAENDLLAYLETIDLNKANNAVNAPHLVMMQTLKKLSVEGKITFITSYIKEWLEANEDKSLLVFGVYREPLQILSEIFKAPVIQGGINALQKQRIVEDFSTKKIRLLFANVQSAGTGTDGLQDNCSNLFIIELPDKSTDLEQISSRLERLGQKESIIVSYLLSTNTIDVEMLEMVEGKSMITGVINNGASEEELLFKKFKVKRNF